MCGIAGFFNYKTKCPTNINILHHVLSAMQYRGPDNTGIFHDVEIVIGNVRLAIQGLEVSGNQPIYNEDGSVVVVYNGEIYNYPEIKKTLLKKGHCFRSETDTEILVHLYEEYGIHMADELNGMFAFALFDIKNRTLLLSRDRSAQKPFYINDNKDGIFFASELKAMIPFLNTCSLNPIAVRTFLNMGYVLEPHTLLSEVITIEPASTHIFSYCGIKTHKFWYPGVTKSGVVIKDKQEWLNKADDVIKAAVKRHLISDVPITLFLSGGIDSSLLALYLSEEGIVKNTYTASFTSDKSHDEYSYARNLGEYCGFKTERILLDNKTLADNLDVFINRSSMPQGDYSGLATYCIAKEVGKSFKVVLGGDGADEIFGGYPTYTFPYINDRLSAIPNNVLKTVHWLSVYSCNRNKYLSLPFKLQQLSLAWNKDIVKAHFSLKNFLPKQIADVILKKDFFYYVEEESIHIILQNIYNSLTSKSTIKKLCSLDYATFMRSATIPKVERNTMLFSLECRMPYLDNEVIELSINTDESLLVDKLTTKSCLKELLNKKTKSIIECNPIKQGFNPPLHMMFDNELKDWKNYCMNISSPIFIDNLEHELTIITRKNHWDTHRLEWNICVLNDWCHRNGIY